MGLGTTRRRQISGFWALLSTWIAIGLSRIEQIPANSFCRVGFSPGMEGALVNSRTAHRRNHDGSFDAICRTCFATVAHSSDEDVLEELERNHTCDASVLAGREILLFRTPRTGIHLVPHPLEIALPAASATASGTSCSMQKPDM